jgi:hypothetical protein
MDFECSTRNYGGNQGSNAALLPKLGTAQEAPLRLVEPVRWREGG